MRLIEIAVFSLWSIGVGVTFLGTLLALLRAKEANSNQDLEPLSILKPLKGIEIGLEENLESFFTVDYHNFELLFSVQCVSDPAIQSVNRLIRKYPNIRAQLVIGGQTLGPNPKVNNMLQSYEMAKHDCILISDSNVRVGPNYLKDIMGGFGNGVGMVTAVVAGTNEAGFGGRLESLFLNTFYARWMYLLFGIGRACVVGKCMLFRKSTLKRIGGIGTLGRYLAEDYMAGEAIRKLGMKVVLAPEPVNQYIGEYKLSAFWARHMRWGRIRKSQAFLAFCIEPIFLCVPSSILGLFSVTTLLNISAAPFILGHLVIWCLMDLTVAASLNVPIKPHFPFYWMLRELSAFPLWLGISCGNSVQWRGKTFFLDAGGLLKSA